MLTVVLFLFGVVVFILQHLSSSVVPVWRWSDVDS